MSSPVFAMCGALGRPGEDEGAGPPDEAGDRRRVAGAGEEVEGVEVGHNEPVRPCAVQRMHGACVKIYAQVRIPLQEA